MARFRHIVEEHPIEGQPGMSLIYADTGFQAVTPFGGMAASYQRPVRVVAGGVDVPIRDHVMVVRLVVVALVIVSNLLRLRHDR
ncbi:MAG: hypothetical protein ACRDX9_08275 [Acidimicrobiia bacterium]